jgi:hypothetical protein
MRVATIVGLLATGAHGLLLAPAAPLTRGAVGQRLDVRMAGVINESIDKENPKVVNVVKTGESAKRRRRPPCAWPWRSARVCTSLSAVKGKKGVYCRCWKSGVFPLCDQAHVKHNEETGDNVGPLIIEKE